MFEVVILSAVRARSDRTESKDLRFAWRESQVSPNEERTWGTTPGIK